MRDFGEGRFACAHRLPMLALALGPPSAWATARWPITVGPSARCGAQAKAARRSRWNRLASSTDSSPPIGTPAAAPALAGRHRRYPRASPRLGTCPTATKDRGRQRSNNASTIHRNRPTTPAHQAADRAQLRTSAQTYPTCPLMVDTTISHRPPPSRKKELAHG